MPAVPPPIESVCDEFCEYIKIKENIKFLTARYSPGYGDLDISCQKTVINLLDTQRKNRTFRKSVNAFDSG